MIKGKKISLPDWAAGLLLSIALLLAFIFQWYPLEMVENKIYDLTCTLRQKVSPSPVVIVPITDESILKIGRWPWPRSHIAYAISLLQEYGAKVVGVDILYSEKEANQGLQEIRGLLDEIAQDPQMQKSKQGDKIITLLRKAEERLDSDAIFEDTLSSSKNVTLPLYFDLGNPVEGSEAEKTDFLKANSVIAPAGPDFTYAAGVVPPIQEFATHAAAIGHINVMSDRDGVIRSEPLIVNYQKRMFPSFALQLVMKYRNYPLSSIQVSRNVQAGDVVIPTIDKQNMLIKFNKSSSFQYYSFHDLIEGKAPQQSFRDKIVIIGLSATGTGALSVTPVGSSMPSIEVIANIVENILNRNFVVRPDWAFYLELSMLVLFGAFVSFVISRLKAGMSAIVSVLLVSTWIGVSLYLSITYGWRIKIFYPTLLFVLGYLVVVSKRYLFTEEAKEHMEADSIETNKMLGLSFQGQGMLDIAFEKFRKCPAEDEAIKELLYNLALDFERKRMFNKAVAVYEHIKKAGDYKDIQEKIKKLKVAGETMIFGMGSGRKDATVLIDNAETKPTLGRYEILKELGRGAMGTVYLGKDPKINREVAIKTLRYEEVDPEQVGEFKKRFFREAEAAGKLAHQNIVTVFDVGEDYDVAYMAMEFMEGTDLEPFCAKDKLRPVREVLKIVSDVASALDYAHANGVVHRDIKPANIMSLKSGIIKVADFGIARVMASSKTQTGVVLGTPSYMSPEQISGKKVDGRSDLFSLGVVLYELLSGEKPFDGDSIASLMYSITNSPHKDIRSIAPSVPDCCISIIDKLLSKDVEARYQRGRDLANDITDCITMLNVLGTN